jgi:DNA-binding CsgD family transcriptional regulator
MGPFTIIVRTSFTARGASAGLRGERMHISPTERWGMGVMTRRGGARAAALGLRVSGRESQVLRWVAAGKSDWEIGMILRISEKTVNCHVQHAKRKLGVGTRIQAVVAAMREGLIDDDPAIARDFDWPMG